MVYAHRFSYALAFGNIPDEIVICHRCDNPACVRPDHLFAGTQKDNLHDMTVKGRRAKSSLVTRRRGDDGRLLPA